MVVSTQILSLSLYKSATFKYIKTQQKPYFREIFLGVPPPKQVDGIPSYFSLISGAILGA